MENLPLPAIHFTCNSSGKRTELGIVRAVRDAKGLSYMGKETIHEWRIDQFYWGSDNRWYRPVHIDIIKKAPFWLRIRTWDDLVIARFELEVQFERPISQETIVKYLSHFIQKSQHKEARTALNVCMSSGDLVAWIERYDTMKSRI